MITTAKRRELIIDPLRREGAVRVEPLSQLLSVSSVTIRINRDVKHILADASKFGRTSFCTIATSARSTAWSPTAAFRNTVCRRCTI